MPKNEFIDPAVVRKPNQITFDPIPVNQYDKTIEDEKINFSKVELLNIDEIDPNISAENLC